MSIKKHVSFVKEFPKINFTDQYLILQKYKKDFHKLYITCLKKYMPIMAQKKTLRSDYSNNFIKILESSQYEEINTYPKVQELFIIENNKHFQDFSDWEDYFSYIDSEHSFKLFRSTLGSKKTCRLPSPSEFVSFFILDMVKAGIILTPLIHNGLFFTNSRKLYNLFREKFINDPRFKTLDETINLHFKNSGNKTYPPYFSLLSMTIDPQDITNDDLDKIYDLYTSGGRLLGKALYDKRSANQILEHTRSIVLGLPIFYNRAGAKVNTPAKRAQKERSIEHYLERLYKLKKDPTFNYNELLDIAIDFFKKDYLVHGNGLNTVEAKIGIIMTFFNMLHDHYEGKPLTKDMMSRFLDYPNSKDTTYQELLKEREKDGYSFSSLARAQGVVVDLLDSTGKFYGCFKENSIVKFKNKTFASLYRESLDDEVYDLIVDILINRPPSMKGIRKWGTRHVDWSDWWPHEVAPFLPMALLLNMYIPLRAIHLLNLDRDNFLVENPDGTIQGMYINTDKDTSRKELYVIPNIYKDSINIYKKLIELNKAMYPNLQKVKYQWDENSPWEEFYPLFPNYTGEDSLSKHIYENYFRLVVLQAQLELYKAGKEIKIAWHKDTDAFPYSVDVIQNIESKNFLQKIKLSFGLHTLRVTGATRLLKLGLPPQLIRLFTGHKDIKTLINIYLKIPHDELIESFFKIQDTIDTRSTDGLSRDHKKIPKAIIDYILSENPDDILKELKKNHIFTLPRMASSLRKTTIKRQLISNGLEEIVKIHWTHWQSYHYGICGKPDGCPLGAENRCSLCPYLATGPLYLNGVIAKLEQIQKRVFVQSNMILKNRNLDRHDENKTLRKQQAMDIEEMTGWYEVLAKIEETINENLDNSSLANKSDIQPYQSKVNLVTYEMVPEMTGLIQIYEKAKTLKIYNPDIEDTIYRLSNDIIHWCIHHQKTSDIQSFLDQPEKIIEWFIPNHNIEFKESTPVLSA